jgi:hypothetical protein
MPGCRTGATSRSTAGDEAWLWLEFVTEATERVWPLGHFAVAARDLGRFNGAYLAGSALPEQP